MHSAQSNSILGRALATQAHIRTRVQAPSVVAEHGVKVGAHLLHTQLQLGQLPGHAERLVPSKACLEGWFDGKKIAAECVQSVRMAGTGLAHGTAESLTSPSAYLTCLIVSSLAELWVSKINFFWHSTAMHIWMNLMHRVRALL